MAMTLISSTTVSNSTTSSIVFNSIPQTYTFLYIVGSVRSDRASSWDRLLIRPNGSSSNQTMFGGRVEQASSMSGGSYTVWQVPIPGNNHALSTAFGALTMHIANYTSTTRDKLMLLNGGTQDTTVTGGTIQFYMGGRWQVSGTAITSLSFLLSFGTYIAPNSRIDLYGIN